MKVLLVWPVFPESYWSFEKILEIVDKKALMPPLGVITVAGLLPQDWDFRLVDKNVRDLTEDDWAWADIVMMSSMIVQQDDYQATIREAVRRKVPIAVGGPYATSVPEDAEDVGADYLVLDEGEITVPRFVEALQENPGWRRGEGEKAKKFTSRGAKPEMAESAPPRFDLLDMSAYDMMAVQYSRGCPFLCEFCDIINLYGRVPRTKPIDMMLHELQILYDLGWRGAVFLVDDNFIGNKKNVKALMHDLKDWQRERGYPFHLDTEASVDLAADDELLDLMVACNFSSVFLGIETPDVESLELTRKHQNNRGPMSEAIQRITRKGMRVMAGFIIGFDNEKQGADHRLLDFVEQTNITHALLAILQVLPNTGLHDRMVRERRLFNKVSKANQSELMNYLPTRPAREVAEEYINALAMLYEPARYMERVYRHCLEVGIDRPDRGPDPADPNPPAPEPFSWKKLRAKLRFGAQVVRLIALQGFVRNSRSVFWRRGFEIWRKRPEMLGHFLTLCAHNEHFIHLNKITSAEMRPKLAGLSDEIYVPVPEEETKSKKRAPAITTHLVAE